MQKDPRRRVLFLCATFLIKAAVMEGRRIDLRRYFFEDFAAGFFEGDLTDFFFASAVFDPDDFFVFGAATVFGSALGLTDSFLLREARVLAVSAAFSSLSNSVGVSGRADLRRRSMS